jgi:hypothetical protein
MSRRAVASACAALVMVGAFGAFGGANSPADAAGPSSREAVKVVEAMRAAPLALQFSGVVRVGWLAGGKWNHVTVGITDDRGAIVVRTGGTEVFDRGPRTYFKNRLGWSSALVETDLAKAPAPDHRWTLSVRRGPTIVGRPTQLVEATRGDGTPAQRLFVDAVTGLLLRRDLLDARGRVQRSLEFLDLDVATVAPLRAPTGVATHDAVPLTNVPAGYEAPRTPGGYELVARSRHDDGIELLYSDGLFSASVLEQRGELDWGGLPAHGVDTDVDGTKARRYITASADVLVWERDGIVFTVVSDSPRDAIDGLFTRFTPDRSAMEKVADFVLGPFGWS